MDGLAKGLSQEKFRKYGLDLGDSGGSSDTNDFRDLVIGKTGVFHDGGIGI
jgi:hypothetical protein